MDYTVRPWTLDLVLALVCNSQPPAFHLFFFPSTCQTLQSSQLVSPVMFCLVLNNIAAQVNPLPGGAGLERWLSALQRSQHPVLPWSQC